MLLGMKKGQTGERLKRTSLGLETRRENIFPTPLLAAVSTLSGFMLLAWLRSKVQSSKQSFLDATKTSPWTLLVFCV